MRCCSGSWMKACWLVVSYPGQLTRTGFSSNQGPGASQSESGGESTAEVDAKHFEEPSPKK